MPLNLGNVTKDVSDDMSFEDAYIEWMEADQQFMNIVNAMEIAEKAKASQSAECIHFAEELLGCSLEEFTASMEVQIRPGKMGEQNFGHIRDARDEASKSLYRTIAILQKKINSYPKEISKKVTIKVPDELVAFAKRGMMTTSSNEYIVRKLTYSQTITVCKAVIRFIITNFSGKEPPKGFVEAYGYKSAKDYLESRRFAAKLIKKLRKVLQQLDKVTK